MKAKPIGIWIGLIFLTLGVFGALDALAVWDWTSTVGAWWPVAVIGFGVAAMLDDGRLTVGGVVISGIGLALLVEQHGWAGEDIIWSALLVLIGVAILVGSWRGERGKHTTRRSAVPTPSGPHVGSAPG